ncbi:hypothetical protein EDC04DRAFT_678686 [Pisolithus marmoratus]|nr:hypothetical protein EDC04DRAFT_678686 [Pisolithus marmoratus]
MATVDEWRSSHSSLEKVNSAAMCVYSYTAHFLQAYHECQTSLRTEPGRLSWWLNGRKVRKRRYALLMVVGVMKLLLQDIMFAIDWWTNLYNVVKIWQDAACLLTSGRSFNDGLEYELVRPIHEIDSYCVGFQSLAERLRKIADNMAQDRRRVGDL